MKIAILSGPTATGKTALALELAASSALTGKLEIINADSLLVYRGMDIGTAKPSPAELAQVPHHLIDIREPAEPFTAGDFVRETESAIQGIHARGKRALIVGGTGFYLKALLYGLWEIPASDPKVRGELERLSTPELFDRLKQAEPASAFKIGPNDRYRLVRALEMIAVTGMGPAQLKATHQRAADPRFELHVLDRPNEELEKRIEIRTRTMLQQGLLKETQAIRQRAPEARALSSVGYAQVCHFLDGRPPSGRKQLPGEAGLAAEISLATRQLVKRQRTWFRAEQAARWTLLDEGRAALMHVLTHLYRDHNATR